MSSRIRFASARDVFEAFSDLRHAASSASGRFRAARLRAGVTRFTAPDRRHRLHRLSPSAPRGRLVGAPMRPRDARRERRRRGPSRGGDVGARAGRGQPARRARGRQRQRSQRADDLARVRRRSVRRQPEPAGPTADASAALGLRDGGEHGGDDGGLRRRSARRGAENHSLRRSRHLLRRRRRRDRHRADTLGAADAPDCR